MKSCFTLIFIFTLSIHSFAGVPAARGPHESFAEARSRSSGNRVQVYGNTAEDLMGPLASLDLMNVTELPDLQSLTAGFELARDRRFIKSNNAFIRRITWLYPDDGCYARAELASQIIQEKGYPPPAKMFAFGKLWAKTENSPSGSVTWWYHVAIAYRIKTIVYILDPAIEATRPLTLQEWAEHIGLKRTRVDFTICSANAFDPDYECHNNQTVDRGQALREQFSFLSPEWARVKSLGHDPNLYLGDQPPWLHP